MSALEVDALASGVSGQQHLNLWVVLERFLYLQALFASDAAVDNDDGLLAPEKRRDALFQVIERVAVLGEDDQLLVGRRLGRWNRANGRFADMLIISSGGENFPQQTGQLTPLG